MRVLLLSLLAIMFVHGEARSDYVEVRRSAWIRTKPSVDSASIREAVVKETIRLADGRQQHGFYRVLLDSGEEGWIYRSLVRRFPGDPPRSEPAASEPAGATAGDQPSLRSPHAYGGVPLATDGERIKLLAKSFFAVGYCEERRNPRWVCYTLEAATDLVPYPSKRFITDRDTTARVSHEDYTNSGFSRGHMAPRFAISSRYGRAGNDETYVMSNVCPQYQDFNDGQWGNLEEWIAGRKKGSKFVKGWADHYERVWVVVGPIFDRRRSPLNSRVDVPNAYFCIVVDEEQGKPRVLAFIMEHEDERDGDLAAALRSVDEVERRTGLDFLSQLPDDIEEGLERDAATSLWPLPVNPN